MTDPILDPILDPLDQPISRRTAKRSLLYAGAVVGVVLAALVLAAGYQFSQANKAAAALCTFRADLQQRVDSGRDFLRDHPDGIPGISAKQIQDSLNNQQRTIDSLRGLSCPPALAPSPSP